MSSRVIIWLLAGALFMPFAAMKAEGFEWPWTRKPEARKSYDLYPKPDKKTAKKIKKARKKKAKELAEGKNAKGHYNP